MLFPKTLIAAAAALASLSANAALSVTETATASGTFLALASTGAHSGTLGSGFGVITGGAILSADTPTADMQAFGSPFGGTFLAAGFTATGPALVTLTVPASSLSFLWGSPDVYNSLAVTTNLSTYTFTPGGNLSFNTLTGDQSYAQYVGFTATGSEVITGLEFRSNGDSFEAANFQVTAAVPEPQTYALLLAGLGVIAFVGRRRRTD